MEHVVQEDECLHSIAEQYGFFWSTLWNHVDNADLKNERKDPEALVPGDLVRIPPLTVRDEKCPSDNAYVFRKKNPNCFHFAVDVETEEPPCLEAEAEFEEPPALNTDVEIEEPAAFEVSAEHEELPRPEGQASAPASEVPPLDVAPGVEVAKDTSLQGNYIDIVLRYENGERLASVKYELEISGASIKGKTDQNGRLKAEAPAQEAEGKLTIWPDESDAQSCLTWPVRINALPPITEISGIQARLNNLGFDAGPVTGAMTEQTRAALQQFQELLGYDEPTGELDGETTDMLEAMNSAL